MQVSLFLRKRSASYSGSPSKYLLAMFSFLTLCGFTAAVGGIAELKAITGDAPYLGTGNQEIAGEVYVSRSGVPRPYSNYAYNRQYQRPYYNNHSPCRNAANYYNGYNTVPAVAPATNTGGGRYYQGSGNPYVNGRT
ncbi:hypothetical protein L596_006059 [Steinernema carpocapsae]|uniref:Uncharacterized protein n=1 Tax=Steinernema carpocapsae TaxID=34508 RepID=A0A4V6I8T5_STECR|nr:hypothetical protein L596_006059 [Steinernema carpocapsae]